MHGLPLSLQHWPSDAFNAALKSELEALPSGSLPLEKGVSRCGLVDDNDISVTILNTRQSTSGIQARAGVFFTEIVAGCVCGDEPTAENAYCELLVTIDLTSGEADFEVIPG